MSGALSVQLSDTTGTWTFDSLYAEATTTTEYTLRFSNHWLASVDQIIEVTLGVTGYALVIVLPDDFAGTYTSAQTVALESMTVKVVDAGGNDMGSADRFSSSHASSAVARMLAFTSDTLELTGATATTTNGVVHVNALSLVEPKVRTARTHPVSLSNFEFRRSIQLTFFPISHRLASIPSLPVKLKLSSTVPTSARHYSAILSSSTSLSAHTKDFASLVRRKRNTLLRSERMFFPQRYVVAR